MKNIFLLIALSCLLCVSTPNIIWTHHSVMPPIIITPPDQPPQPPQPQPSPRPQPSPKPALTPTWDPKSLPTTGITYDFLYNLIPPQADKKALPESDTTQAVNFGLHDINKIGKFPLSYFIPYDLELLNGWNGITQIFPGASIPEKSTPALNIYLRQILILTFAQMIYYWENSPETQTTEYLIELGQPTLSAIKIMLNPGSSTFSKYSEHINRIATNAQNAIGEPATQPPPEAQMGKTHFETMINRLIVEELGRDYYYPGNNGFANRLNSLGDDVIPYIIDAVKHSPHSLIKRNAVALLGSYENPAATEALREALKGPDKVARNRALAILINRKDSEIVPFLINALKESGDGYFNTFAIYALGVLGDKRAVKPILEYSKIDPNHRDILWAVIPALGRIGDNSEEVMNFLKKVSEQKRGATKTLALLSRYALGDKSAFDQLGINPDRHPLRKVEFPSHYFALKVFQITGEKDVPILLSIINDDFDYDPRFRLAAMFSVKFNEKHISNLRMLIEAPKTPPIQKAYALYNLFLLKDKDISKYAQMVLSQSLSDMKKRELKIQGEGFDTVIALRVLGALKANKESVLKEIIDSMYQNTKLEHNMDKTKIVPVPHPPVIETAITELAHMNATQELLDLSKLTDLPWRADVMMAFGQTQSDKSVIEVLIKSLFDEDGWIRYCAYCSLNKLTGKDFNCEWVFDPPEKRKIILKEWEKWWKEESSQKEK